MNNENLKALAAQLRNPNGHKGIEIAEMMNETNINMTLHSIQHLSIQDNDTILELGHGNGKHLAYILTQRSNLSYHGLEISELMHQEAMRINQESIDKHQAFFHLYDGSNIPFSDNYFDKIFTVNTIYFWNDPKSMISELYRVIKPNGLLNITFAQEDFMEKLPFTHFNFTLYNNEKIKKLFEDTPFQTVSQNTQKETVKSKMGDLIDRDFTTFSLKK